ncbi:unnamed protein product [marine sediment metagenome]|uniref:Uncharacterized protein n=1 Tax=marine sediment metagenome TaxID=412755 RepID=X1BLS6_9ZZZZ
MRRGKKLIVGLLSLIIVMVMFSTAEGKSVYVINDTDNSKLERIER